jgi:hypothetical protein
MWIFTKYGYFSVVSARMNEGLSREIDPETLMIRSRSKEHLENLKNSFASLANFIILETSSADYRYRIFVPKLVWAEIMSKMTEDIDYDNFKNETSKYTKNNKGNYEYVKCLSDIWGVMYDFQNQN